MAQRKLAGKDGGVCLRECEQKEGMEVKAEEAGLANTKRAVALTTVGVAMEAGGMVAAAGAIAAAT